MICNQIVIQDFSEYIPRDIIIFAAIDNRFS